MKNVQIKTKELFKAIPEEFLPLFEGREYPWEILPHIHGFLVLALHRGIQGYGYDEERGILVGPNVKIAPSAVIEGPAILGEGTEIRPFAYLRGDVIVSPRCVVGNSTELKNCILLEGVHVPHFNYVGDSILGSHSHLGAGAICSNFRQDGGEIMVRGSMNFRTGLNKVGCFLGEGVEIGCNSVLNPGTIVGEGSRVYPLSCLRGIYPKTVIVKGDRDITDIE